LTALDSATFALLNEAATEASRLNNFEKLTDAIGYFIERIKNLPPKKYELMYDKISVMISNLKERGVINNSLMAQIKEFIDQDTE